MARHRILNSEMHIDVTDSEPRDAVLTRDWWGVFAVSNAEYKWDASKSIAQAIDGEHDNVTITATRSEDVSTGPATIDWAEQSIIVSGTAYDTMEDVVWGSLTVVDFGVLYNGNEVGTKVVALVNDELTPAPLKFYGCGDIIPETQAIPRGWHAVTPGGIIITKDPHEIVSQTHTDVDTSESPTAGAVLVLREQWWTLVAPDAGSDLPQVLLSEDGTIKYDAPIQDNDSWHVVWDTDGWQLYNDSSWLDPYSYYGTLEGGDDGWHVNDFVGDHVGGTLCKTPLSGDGEDTDGDGVPDTDPCAPPEGTPTSDWCATFGGVTASCDTDNQVGEGTINDDTTCPGRCVWTLDLLAHTATLTSSTCTTTDPQSACRCPQVVVCDWDTLALRVYHAAEHQLIGPRGTVAYVVTACQAVECGQQGEGGQLAAIPAEPPNVAPQCRQVYVTNNMFYLLASGGAGALYMPYRVLNDYQGNYNCDVTFGYGVCTKRISADGPPVTGIVLLEAPL